MSRLALRGRVVAITGGASGIGLEVARECAGRGARVALLDVDGERAGQAASGLAGGAVGLAADVTDLDALEDAVAEAADRLGGLDVLVANAGIGPIATSVDAGDREHQRRVLDVNLHGVWHTAWAGGARIAAGGGHFVVISSIAAFVVTPNWAAYSASKAAVEQLARSMRVELAPTGATVQVAHFGVVDTPLVDAFEADPLSAEMENLGPSLVTRKVSPQAAARALVNGIERRAPRTVYPARWRVPYALRGVMGPLSDAVLRRDPRVRALMRRVRERDTQRVKETVR